MLLQIADLKTVVSCGRSMKPSTSRPLRMLLTGPQLFMAVPPANPISFDKERDKAVSQRGELDEEIQELERRNPELVGRQ